MGLVAVRVVPGTLGYVQLMPSKFALKSLCIWLSFLLLARDALSR